MSLPEAEAASTVVDEPERWVDSRCATRRGAGPAWARPCRRGQARAVAARPWLRRQSRPGPGRLRPRRSNP